MIETTNQMAIGLSQNLRLKTLAKSQVSVPIKSVGSGYTTCSDIPKSIQIECIYIYIGINMGINSHIPEYSKKHLSTNISKPWPETLPPWLPGREADR